MMLSCNGESAMAQPSSASRDYMFSSDHVFDRDYLPQKESEKTMTSISREDEEAPLSTTGKETASGYVFHRLYPHVSNDLIFDTNIYNVQFGKKDDVITTTNCGINFFAKDKEGSNTILKMDAGLRNDVYYYSDKHYKNPYISATATTGKKNCTFLFSNFFKKDFTRNSSIVTGESGFTPYYYNTTRLKGSLRYRRVGFDAVYKRTAYEFSDPAWKSNNNQDNGFTITGYFRPTPARKLNLLAEFENGRVEYLKTSTADSNYTYSFVWVGMNGPLTKKIRGLIKVGFNYYHYEEGKDNQGYPVNIMLDYRYSPRTTYSLIISSMGLLSANAAVGSYGGNNIALRCDHNFTSRLKLHLDVHACLNTQKVPKCKNKGYGCIAKLNYNYSKWMRLALQYTNDVYIAGGSQSTGYKDSTYIFRTEIGF